MHETSLSRKLLALIILSVGGAQALVVAFSLWGEAQRYAINQKDLLLAETHVLAAAVSGPAARKDRAGVYAALRAAGRLPSIRFVSVEDGEGERMAELGAAELLTSDLLIDATTPLTPWDLLRARSFASRAPIVQGGSTVGTLVLIGDAGDLKQSLKSGLSTSAGAAAIAMLLAIALATRMQKAITRPLSGLVGAMRKVAASHDYALAVAHSEIAEINVLVSGFNRMLSGIRDRDARIARSYAELEAKVEDRTRDLRAAMEAAEAAKAAADEANAHKSSFLATMSHEIRTPMNGMLVMAELLARSSLPASAQRYAEVVWRSGKSLLAIINDILDFSKIEAGKLELGRARVDVADTVATVLDLFGERARAKGLDLAARIAADAPRAIVGDSVRLTQVLGNLVNNALKFTERGGVRLRVERAGEAGVTFHVEDTGVGIEPDKHEQIFSAFSQADMSTTRKYGGTGLGLAICQRLVSAMGAEITVASEPGRGSVFSFTLPNCAQDGEVCAPLKAAAPARVLVVGFGDFTRETLGYYLSDAATPCTFVALPDLADLSLKDVTIIAEWTLGSAPALRSARDRGATLIAAPTQADAAGVAEADACLSWPISRTELQSVLLALRSGGPRADERGGREVQTHAPFRGVHALVADDNEINQEVAREALARLGVTTTIVADGAAAVAAFAAAKFDIVFLDGSMPVLDGFEAARQMRCREQAAPRAERTPIVALTAHVLGRHATEWKEAGMDDLLAKPFTLEQLRRCLAAALPSGATAGPIAAAPDQTSDARDPLVDFAIFAELERMSGAGAADFLGRIARLYQEHGPKCAADLARAALQGDGEALGKAAHALKSMSLNIGARAVATLAAEIEQDAKSSRIAAADRVARLQQTLSETLQIFAAREAGPSDARKRA